VGDRTEALLPEVSFVAIKNGMHQEEGFAFFTKDILEYAPSDKAHVAHLGLAIMNFFDVKGQVDDMRAGVTNTSGLFPILSLLSLLNLMRF